MVGYWVAYMQQIQLRQVEEYSKYMVKMPYADFGVQILDSLQVVLAAMQNTHQPHRAS